MENKDEYIIKLQKELIERLTKELDEKDNYEFDLEKKIKKLEREIRILEKAKAVVWCGDDKVR